MKHVIKSSMFEACKEVKREIIIMFLFFFAFKKNCFLNSFCTKASLFFSFRHRTSWAAFRIYYYHLLVFLLFVLFVFRLHAVSRQPVLSVTADRS